MNFIFEKFLCPLWPEKRNLATNSITFSSGGCFKDFVIVRFRETNLHS
jgi:hypothetical protein